MKSEEAPFAEAKLKIKRNENDRMKIKKGWIRREEGNSWSATKQENADGKTLCKAEGEEKSFAFRAR